MRLGLLSLIGLIASISYTLAMFTVGDKVVSHLCGVFQLTEEERPHLFTTVNRLSKLMQVPRPKIGIVEDLKPNAFTYGHGRKVTLVCSIGLLELLGDREMEAVLAHELAHVRDKDFNFKALTSAFKIAAFYNPLVHLLSSAISRQREILADEIGARYLRDPEYLGRALIRIADASRKLPSNRFRWQIASSLFVISPPGKAASALSSHPPIVNRLSHLIDRETAERRDLRHVLLLLMSCAFLLLLSAGVYQAMNSITAVTFPGRDSGLIARINSGWSFPLEIVGMSLIGPFAFSMPFSIPFHHATSAAIFYQVAAFGAWYSSDGVYSMLLSSADISLAIVILIGTFRTTRRSQPCAMRLSAKRKFM